jgi:hypothetical protein
MLQRDNCAMGVASVGSPRQLAVPSRCAARLPHLTAHDVAAIDGEIRDMLAELGGG